MSPALTHLGSVFAAKGNELRNIGIYSAKELMERAGGAGATGLSVAVLNQFLDSHSRSSNSRVPVDLDDDEMLSVRQIPPHTLELMVADAGSQCHGAGCGGGAGEVHVRFLCGHEALHQI